MKNMSYKFLTLLNLLILLQVGKVNAQCPIGETEITIAFTANPNYEGPLIQWDYLIGGISSDNGPYNSIQTLTICVPDGDFSIVGCNEGFGPGGWSLVNFTVTITEDGSVNGCGDQEGCLLYIGNEYNIPNVEFCIYDIQQIVQLTVGPCNASPIQTTGCTNPMAPNYSKCATTDDGSCILPSANDNCDDAVPIILESIGNCLHNNYPVKVDNTVNTVDYFPSCGTPAADLFYTLTVPPSGSIQFFVSSFDGSAVFLTLYDVCDGTEYFCGTNPINETIANLPVGEEIILQVWQGDIPGNIDLCIEAGLTAPPNDLCENAIPICGLTNGNNFNATTDSSDPLIYCAFYYQNTVWFSFEADGSGDAITINITQGTCGDYNDYDLLKTHILSGNCGGPFVVEDCISTTYYNDFYSLTLQNPVADVPYFVYIDTKLFVECDFVIQPIGGIKSCCNADFSLNPICQLGEDNGFYVELELVESGNNSAGYSINGGAFPNITTPGIYTIGPFPNEETIITIEDLDDQSCFINKEVDFDCGCDELAITVSEDMIICQGEAYEATATLGEGLPGNFTGIYSVTTEPAGSCTAVPANVPIQVILEDDDFSEPIPLDFNFNFWENTYTEFYISSNGYITFVNEPNAPGAFIPSSSVPNNFIALFWSDLVLIDYATGISSGTISYFNAIVNGQNCMVVDFDKMKYNTIYYSDKTVTGQIIICEDGTIIINCIDCQQHDSFYINYPISGIENNDGSSGYFDPALFYGEFNETGSYKACTTFTPNVANSSACDFLYWVTDLNNPEGSIVSIDETATFSPNVTSTYYVVVECENGTQCVDELTITVDLNCGEPCIIPNSGYFDCSE